MWQKLAEYVLRKRIALLVLLCMTTVAMGYFASQVKLSYDFAKAIPTDNPKYQDYQAFKARFGDDGNVVVIGVQNKDFFSLPFYKNYVELQKNIKKSHCVEDVLAVPSAVILERDSLGEKLQSRKIFSDNIENQSQLDSAAALFKNLPFSNLKFFSFLLPQKITFAPCFRYSTPNEYPRPVEEPVITTFLFKKIFFT